MTRNSVQALLLIALVGGAGLFLTLDPLQAKAQTSDIVLDAQGTCPAEGSLTRGAPSSSAFPTRGELDLIQGSVRAISRPFVTLFRNAEQFDEDSIQGKRLNFGEKVEVMAYGADDDAAVLVKHRGGTDGLVCGWMLIGDTLSLRLSPRKIVQLPGREDDVGVDGRTPSSLTAKVVARASQIDGKVEPVPVFTKPDSRLAEDKSFLFAKDTPINFFSVADVLDVRRDDNRDSGGDACFDLRDLDCFLLLAGRNAKGQQDLIGWVRGAEVELWPSTMSLYFAPGKRGIPYFFSSCGAKASVPGLDPGVCSETEPMGTGSYTDVRGSNVPRFPVIGVEVKKRDAGPPVYIYEAVAALEVCKIGSNRQACRDATAVLQEEGDVGRGIDALRTVDILFVIDGTGSMADYFPPVVDAAIKFADKVARNKQIEARFGAAVYGDYTGKTGRVANVSFERTVDFGNIGDAQVLRSLLATDDIQKRIRDIHGDQVEAPYAALARAIDPDSARWSADAGIRLVIWVGDVGNRAPGEHDSPGTKAKMTETVAAEDVADMILKARDGNKSDVLLSAIHVPSDEARLVKTNRESFKKSYNALGAAIEAKLGKNRVYEQRSVTASTANDVREEVLEAFDDILNSVRAGEQAAENCRSSPERCASFTDAVAPDITSDNQRVAVQIGIELADQLGLLDRSDLGRLQEGEVVAVQRIFFAQTPEDADFGYWLGLTPREIDDLIVKITNLCEELDYRDFGQPLLDAYLAMLESATREVPDPGMSNAEFRSKALSIPKEQFSSVVDPDKSFTDLLIELQADDDLTDRFQAAACKRSEVLRLVRAGERIGLDQLEWRENRVRLARDAKLEEFDWDWSGSGGGNRYYFFPLNFLP